MNNHIVELAKRGQLNKREMNKEKTEALFKRAARGVNPAVARFFVEASADTTEATLINWAGNSNGLTKGQASALCKSAQAFAVQLLKDDGQPKSLQIVNKATLQLLPDLVQAALEAYFADDDLDDDDATDDATDDLDDDLMSDLDDLADDDDDATVDAGFVEYAEIEAAWANPRPFINAARLAFMADDNLNTDGHHTFFIDGKSKSKKATVMVATNNKSVETVFMNKVATMGGMNLAGLATKRGNDWCSSTIFKGIRPKNINLNQKLRLRLGVAYCVVAVKAGVTRFNHDLRKYISDETIEALRNMVVEDDADMEHPAASTNGWFLPYQRGQVVSERASYDDLLSDLTLL